jgi:hypothetical protein
MKKNEIVCAAAAAFSSDEGARARGMRKLVFFGG